MNKLILLDRDGVINEPLFYSNHGYVLSWGDFHFIPGTLEALKLLNEREYKIGICTNQSCISKGLCDYKDVFNIHEIMGGIIRDYGGMIHHICTCPHAKEDNCTCRKPNPSMLLNVIKFYHVEPKTAWYVGDQMSDLQAAKNAGCKFCFVKSGWGLSEEMGPLSDMIRENLYDFAKRIINEEIIRNSNTLLSPGELLST